MTIIETLYWIIGLAAFLAVIGAPTKRGGNTNPPPTGKRPPMPPSPPPSRIIKERDSE